MSTNKDETKLLGGLLLIAVLLLIYYHYCEDDYGYYDRKRYNRGCEGMNDGNYAAMTKNMYGTFKSQPAYRNSTAINEQLSSLDFGPVNSMHDLELNRGKIQHMTTERKKLYPNNGSRWMTESFVAIDPSDQLSESNSNNSLLASGAVSIGNVDGNSYISDVDGAFKLQNNNGITIPAEIVTPNKTCNVDRTAYNSVSGSQLSLMDFDLVPTYGTNYRRMDI